jgi:hypothetical protein
VTECGVAEFTERLQRMSAEECERYARALLDDIGGPTFEKYLSVIAETMMPAETGDPPDSVDAYYLAVRGLFPHIGHGDDRLGRLCALVVQLCRLHLSAQARGESIEKDQS